MTKVKTRKPRMAARMIQMLVSLIATEEKERKSGSWDICLEGKRTPAEQARATWVTTARSVSRSVSQALQQVNVETKVRR